MQSALGGGDEAPPSNVVSGPFAPPRIFEARRMLYLHEIIDIVGTGQEAYLATVGGARAALRRARASRG